MSYYWTPEEEAEMRDEYYRRLEEEQYYQILLNHENAIREIVICIQDCLIWLYDNNRNNAHECRN